MRLDISAAAFDVGQEFDFQLTEQYPPEKWNGDEVSFDGPVTLTGRYVMVGGQVLLYGQATATLVAPCADCLDEARVPVDTKVEARFAKEEDPEDPELCLFEGHLLPLDDVIRGAIFASLPMRILCKPDCQGLCPRCGVDRNHHSCSCQKEMPSEHPFSALASLLIQDEEV